MATPEEDILWRSSAVHLWMDRIFAMVFDINFMVDFILFCITGSNFRNALKLLFVTCLHTLFPSMCGEEILKEQRDSLNSATGLDLQSQNRQTFMLRNTVAMQSEGSENNKNKGLNSLGSIPKRSPITLKPTKAHCIQPTLSVDRSSDFNYNFNKSPLELSPLVCPSLTDEHLKDSTKESNV